jgi:hypothetical protein
VFQNDVATLPHLVRLCVVAVPLYINVLLDTGFTKQVMASFNALIESQSFQQDAQIVKTDRLIRGATQQPLKCFRGPQETIVLRQGLIKLA